MAFFLDNDILSCYLVTYNSAGLPKYTNDILLRLLIKCLQINYITFNACFIAITTWQTKVAYRKQLARQKK